MATSNNRSSRSRTQKSSGASRPKAASRSKAASSRSKASGSGASRSKAASGSGASRSKAAGRSGFSRTTSASSRSRTSAPARRKGASASNGSGALQKVTGIVGTATRKAKVPVIAGGATAAAVAGGALLIRQLTPKRRKVLGVPLPAPKLDGIGLKPIAKQISKAGKRATSTSEQLAKLSGDVQRVGKTAEKMGDSLS